jgi:RimJ/RimL family protein N-acetyltransferase
MRGDSRGSAHRPHLMHHRCMTSWLSPVTLRGAHASLVPLSRDHAAALAEAAADGELWNLWYTNVPTRAGMAQEIDRRLALQQSGAMLPFAVLDGAGVAVGMTTYLNIDAVHRRLEIGGTWYAKRVQRTALNTECKRMLLAHAFDELDCIAVEFRTSTHNAASRRAIERLGAKLDGILRSHVRHRDGTLRDTCVYSITAAEWPAAKAHLDGQLARRR